MPKDSPHEGEVRLPIPEGSVKPVTDGNLMAGSSVAQHRGDIEDLLQQLPDRKDLERLYERDVPMEQILRLLGHQVEPREIKYLLHCEDPHGEIRRILGTE